MKKNFDGVPREIIFGLIFIGLIITISLFFWREQSLLKNQTDTVVINGQTIDVQIADTNQLRYQGLSGQKKICELCGMLFIFPETKVEEMVMRNMNFPLDIIYINNNKIVKIDANLLPEGADPLFIYSSELPVDYILEVNSSFTDKYDITVGNEVTFNFKNKK
ncbi:MAG: DUF192 domain-containing protein [Candidatus Falkowbacteria bacterium]